MSSNLTDLEVLASYRRLKQEFFLYANKVFTPEGIGTHQAILIRELKNAGEISLTQLAGLTTSDLAATGRAIDALIKKGWVEKKAHPQDRRQWLISLTKEGLLVTTKLKKIQDKLAGDFCAALSESEKKQMVGSIDKISAHFHDLNQTSIKTNIKTKSGNKDVK
jgi:DNA-binding MarR family transcriptional regulator